MITFSTSKRGINRPVFVCDQCGEPIQGEGAGLIQWDSYENPTFTVLHKGPAPCSRQWEQEHGRTWIGWLHLEKFLDQLSYNTLHPFKKKHPRGVS